MTASKKITSHASHTITAAHAVPTEASAPTEPTAPPVASTPNVGLLVGSGLLEAPPPGATVPSVPQGFEPAPGATFRGIQPWSAELVVLPKALKDLARFADYAQVLGKAAPPLSQVVEFFDVGNRWSSMRNAASAWDAYCREQEAAAWRGIQALMDRLRGAFRLAVRADASLATQYPSLAELLDVKQASALRGLSTKRLNKQAVAEGRPPIHGAAGKRRQRAAAKKALAASEAASAPAPAPVPTSASTSASASAPAHPPAAAGASSPTT